MATSLIPSRLRSVDLAQSQTHLPFKVSVAMLLAVTVMVSVLIMCDN